MTTIGTTAAAIRRRAPSSNSSSRVPRDRPRRRDSLAAVIVMVTFLELVVGELVPKSLALRYSDRLLVLRRPALVALSQVMRRWCGR